MRPALSSTDRKLHAILEPHRLLRWNYLGRISLATAIFIAAVIGRAANDDLVISALAFTISIAVTVASAGWSEIYGRPLTATFRYLQSVFDLLLVTAVVHLTNGSQSQFSALYILVIAAGSLLLPAGGVLLVAALGNVLYVADVVWFSDSVLTPSVWLQLLVFAIVALGSAYLSGQLQRAGEGKEVLEAELAHQRLQADQILANIRSGILTVDSQGRLLYANATAASLLGFDFGREIGRPILASLAAIAPDLARALERSVRDRVRVTRAEGVVQLGDRHYPVGVTTTYTEGDGARTDRTATAIFSDISDQKRLETLRLRAERLEGVAELSASLAHEIKNPLASIRSAVEQLSQLPRATDDERTLGALVLRESDRLARLLTEFIDFARVRVAQTQPVDVAEVARGAARLAATHPERREGVRVTCTVPEGVSFVVEGDEDLLHRALFNIVLNAVQASPAGAEVRVEVRAGTAESLPGAPAPDDSTVVVSVTDEGPGIPHEIRDRLFDPFFTTKPGGSGLGLAIVHRAIDAHRGVVLVDSSPTGTRFTVIVPRAHSPALAVP